MLSPRYLASAPKELTSLYSDLEIQILTDIANRLSNIDNLTSEELNKLIQEQYDHASKLASEIQTKAAKVTQETISNASNKSIEKDNTIFKQAFNTGHISSYVLNDKKTNNVIKKGVKQTTNSINEISRMVTSSSNKQFQIALDNARVNLNAGASIERVIEDSIKNLGRKGIQLIEYSKSFQQVDACVRRAIITGTNQTALKAQMANFDEMGGNLVEVTAHADSRPEHAAWQGKVYWVNDPVKGYSSFEAATGYGRGSGLGGWNCRHSFFPFFPGISETSSDDIVDNYDKGLYDLEQQQRYNERKIREWKRRSEVMNAGGLDNSFENRKVSQWQSTQRNLMNKHKNLLRSYDREKAFVASKGMGAKSFGYIDNDKVEYINRGKLTITDKETKIKVLKAYEARLSTLDHERTVIITKEGSIYEVIGTKGRVFPEVIGIEKLEGAYVTHNHPIDVTEYTFSRDDINAFKNYKYGILRAIDEKFEYQVSYGGVTVIDDAYNDWMSPDNFHHANILKYCLDNGLYYWRKSK